MFSPRDAVLVAAGALSGALAAVGATAYILNRKHFHELEDMKDAIAREAMIRKEATDTSKMLKAAISEQEKQLEFFLKMPAEVLAPYLPSEDDDMHEYDPDVEAYDSEMLPEGADSFGCQVLSEKEWAEREGRGDFDDLTLRYYVKDDTLVGPNNRPVEFPNDLIGEALSVISVPSSGTTTAYIRNFLIWADITLEIYADAFFEKDPDA